MIITSESDQQHNIRRNLQQMLASISAESCDSVSGTFLIVPSYIPAPEQVLYYCLEHNCGKISGVGEGGHVLGEGVRILAYSTFQEREHVMRNLTEAHQVLIINPPLALIQSIVRGMDCGFFEQLFLRALLWNKKTSIFLDYEKPKFRRGTYFQELNDAFGAIEEMGAQIISLPMMIGRTEGGLSLVTERDVIEANRAQQQNIRCAKGAIITPLARDAAKDFCLNIQE